MTRQRLKYNIKGRISTRYINIRYRVELTRAFSHLEQTDVGVSNLAFEIRHEISPSVSQ